MLVSVIRSHYPRIFGIRRTLQTLKVRRIRRRTLPDKKIKQCEEDPSRIEAVIKPYVQKWGAYLSPVTEEADYLLGSAPKYADGRFDKEKLRLDMIFCRLAYGFIPSEYVSFGFENKNPQERKEYVSDLDISVFGYKVNDIVEVQRILDKAKMSIKYKRYFGRDTLIVNSSEDYPAFRSFVEKHPVFVKKKVFSCKGKGVVLIDLNASGRSDKECFDEILKGGKTLLEELVIQSPEMAAFNPSSVNTVRVRTFRTNDGVKLQYCNLRTGRKGSFVDNGGSGGLLIGVDEKTGVINTNGYDEFGEQYAEHPDSHVVFKGRRLPAWEQLIRTCIAGAEEDPRMGYLSWDMAHTESGWKVIEVNEVGQFVGAQLISGKGLKQELSDYLKIMKKYVW